MTLLELQNAGALDTRPGGVTHMLSGQQTARAVGLSWERFRKVRTDWTRDRDFPAEVNEPGEPVRYLADAVARWLDRRTRRVHGPVEAATVPAAPDADTRRAAAHGRAQLRLLKGGPTC